MTSTARVAVGPLERCGVWSIVRKVPGEKKTEVKPLVELACNLSNRRESDLRPGEGLPERTAGGALALGTRPVWYYLVASAWLLTCWEWFLYQRRWID